jgi:protocatechuate 3,4-dioxygenase beta subunit
MRYIYSIAGRRLAQAATANTDDKGDYRLFGLQPGSYLVVAEPGRAAFMNGAGFALSAKAGGNNPKAESAIYTAKYYPNEISPEAATPVVLKPGDETQANFTLTRVTGHAISGAVTGASQAKDGEKSDEHACVVVALREGSFMPVGMAALGKDSSFKISAVPPGKYKLAATEYAGGEDARQGSAAVLVDSSDVTGVTIVLGSAHNKVTGVVHAEGDTKPDYSKLYVSMGPEFNPEMQFASSDLEGGWDGGFSEVKKDGTFTLELPSSEKSYRTMLAGRGVDLEDWFASKVLIGGKDVLASGFKAAEALHGPVEIIISNNGATLEGSVLDKDQKPVSNAEVIAMSSEPKLRKQYDFFHQTIADQMGRFKIRGVRPGEYLVLALEDSQEQPFATEVFLKNNRAAVQTVKLQAGAKQQLELQVIPAETK